MTLEEENQLALLIQQDDETAFMDIYERYLKPVYSYLSHQTGDVAAAEHLTSETFVLALAYLRQGVMFEQGCILWLFGIAHTLLLAWHQHIQPILLPNVSTHELEQDGKKVFNGIQARKSTKHVWDLVCQLPPHYQQVLILRHIECFSYIEIALRMKLTTHACRALHVRALKKLRERVHKARIDAFLANAE